MATPSRCRAQILDEVPTRAYTSGCVGCGGRSAGASSLPLLTAISNTLLNSQSSASFWVPVDLPLSRAVATLCVGVGLLALSTACLPGKRDNSPLDIEGSADSAVEVATADGSGLEGPADTQDTQDTQDTKDDAGVADGSDAVDAGSELPPDVANDIEETAVGLGGCTTNTQCSHLPFGPCRIGSCALSTGICVAQPLADDTTCTGDKCLLAAKCAGGQCLGSIDKCDDGNGCTVDLCDAATGCVHLATTAGLCDDGFKCTIDDVCTAGNCSGKPKNCDDGNVCSHDVCNPATGECAANALPKDTTMTCVNAQKGCQLSSTCDASKNCVVKSKCDDGNPCTDDACGPGDECLHLWLTGACVPATGPIDTCTTASCEWPTDGVEMPKCVTQVKCEDNICNATACSKNGLCSYTKQESGSCTDGDPCSVDDNCNKGQCKPGSLIKCDDGNPCTTDACTTGIGCTSVAATTSGIACTDGDGCTTTDSCTKGKCAGIEVNCDDGNGCTKDSCDPSKGCQNESLADGSKCTNGTCMGGQCVK